MAIIIDGKGLAAAMLTNLKKETEEFLIKNERQPGLAVVLVGDDAASKVYVDNKIRACGQAGIKSSAFYLPVDITQDKLAELIYTLNKDNNIDGILVQLPLPRHLNERQILALVDSDKDVDGFCAANAGALMLGEDCLAACTPLGCIELIKSTGKSMEGKHAVVIGRSNIVGKPVAMMLLKHNCTVTVCHSKTVNLSSITKKADILVAAIGQKEFVKGDMVKKGAIVIDVGINRFEGKLYGDVSFDEVSKVASYITPVPGGVGPMTIAMLLANTVKAAKNNQK